MRSKKKADKLASYQRQLELSQEWRRQEGYDAMWRRMIELYRGKHFEGLSDDDRIAVNIAFSTANVIFPAISVSIPKISVMANDPENEDRSLFAEAILNYWWNHFDLHVPFRQAAKDFVLIGHGWLKVGWKTKEAQVSYTGAEMEEQFWKAIDERNEAVQADPSMLLGAPTDEEIAESMVESKTIVVEDRVFMERVSPHDMYVNYEATSEQDARWIAQRIIRPLEEVQKDKRYKQSVRLNLTGKTMTSLDSSTMNKKAFGDEMQKVVIWEFYDLVNGKLCIFADGGDDFLVDPMDLPYHLGSPFTMVRNYDVPDHFYPIGDLEMIEPLQNELNATRSAMLNNRKTYARKYLARMSAFGAGGLAALRSSEDGTIIPVEDDNRPFGDIIAPMPQSQLSADMYNMSEIVQGDIREVTGVSEYQRGVSPSVRRTATEAAMIQDATNARSADKLGIIELFIRNISRKQLQIAQQFLTGDQVARVTGANNKQIWLPYTRDDIIGEFDFAVEAGSTAPKNDVQRRQDALGMSQAIAPFMEMGVIDPIAIAKHILQEGFGIRAFEKFITPDAMQQLEMAKQAKAQSIEQQALQNELQQQALMEQQGGMGGGPPELQGEQGVNAPQMAPQDLLAAQQGDTAMSGAPPFGGQ